MTASTTSMAPKAPSDVGGTGATAQQATGSTSDMTVTCSGLAPGVTGLPIDRIVAQAVQPRGNQIQALDDLEIAVDRASELVKASCPIQAPLTPLDRLDAVERRLDAMIQAVHMVRVLLERFSSTLSDAQRARLAAMAGQANGGRLLPTAWRRFATRAPQALHNSPWTVSSGSSSPPSSRRSPSRS